MLKDKNIYVILMQLNINLKQIVTPLVLILFLNACVSSLSFTVPDEQCVASFEEFAYIVPASPTGQEYPTVLPPDGWIRETELPEVSTGETVRYTIETTRYLDEHIEVWIKQHTLSNAYDSNKSSVYNFFVYRTDTKQWEVISAEIANANVFAKSLYVLGDNSLWASNAWDKNSEISEKIVLSWYNEDMHRFEFELASHEIPAIGNTPDGYQPWSTVLPSTESFWIFSPMDALYSYTPSTQKIVKHIEIPEYYVTQAVSAIDGSIYFTIGGRTGFKLQEGEILHFSAGVDEVTPLPIPSKKWPSFRAILLDHSGRLWLDAVGWYEGDETWHILHPKTREYLRKMNVDAAWRWYVAPQIVLESSDGLIWFAGEHNTELNGLAWFDPEIKKGCWITTEGNSIVEDQRNTLWIVADGALYQKKVVP